MKPILIEDYSPEWAITFDRLRSVYIDHLGNLISDIEHVGSTSVPGLATKPVIDIDLIIDDRSVLDSVIEKLAELGYEHMGDLGIKDREAFKRKSILVPDDGLKREWPSHNLYVCFRDGIALRNHLTLRDFLRTNPEKAKQYGALKKRLAAKYPNDIDLYIKNKTPFIIEILEESGFDKKAIEEIRIANNDI